MSLHLNIIPITHIIKNLIHVCQSWSCGLSLHSFPSNISSIGVLTKFDCLRVCAIGLSFFPMSSINLSQKNFITPYPVCPPESQHPSVVPHFASTSRVLILNPSSMPRCYKRPHAPKAQLQTVYYSRMRYRGRRSRELRPPRDWKILDTMAT